ncbi:hypothetical protein QA648_02290 [Rhizobium sp. CB3171]|uniref:hypothetical protein n=1 Tax=Rhizobium sp. CB3171 TaxID=3039157 RepID=UPI0024B0B53D|nr:hypothetical protein [Rhizobium sp. CB3171]WFU02636.1 hypothetical protein QA648_02290 [Rhizobium sp. CB3171]
MNTISLISLSAFLGIGLTLSGCVGTPIDGTKQNQYSHRAISGKKTALGMVASVKRDCTFDAYPYTGIIKQPSHGKVRVKYDKDSDAYVCSGKPVEGTTVYYTSDPGFTGTDQFTLRMTVLYANKVSDENLTIQVVK